MKEQNIKLFKQGPQINVDFFLSENIVTEIKIRTKDKPGLQRNIWGPTSQELLAKIDQWLECYLEGKPIEINFPLFSYPFSLFTQKVHKEIAKVPFGETISYTQLASKCLSPKAFRAAGSACGRNPFLLVIPCHRIINSNGGLGGFGGGLEIKKMLLSFEIEKL
jgi:methylated-DNA-[protein]-cysteine S-methyltransferase